MKLIIHKIRFKNFLAYGNIWTELDLDKIQTTLIVGKNGSGKSTLLDAISFVLFNKPFRKMNKPRLVNNRNDRDCVVEIEFTVNGHFFKVIRGIGPSIFEIWKDDELITQDSDNRDYQKVFEDYILKVNHKTFCQVVMLGSAIFTPFMSLAAQGKRDVIEDLLDLKIFSKMNVLLKDMINQLERTILKNESEKALLEQKVELTTSHIEEMKAHYQHNIDVWNAEIKEKESTIQVLIMANHTSLVEIAERQAQFKKVKSSKGIYKLQSQLALKLSQDIKDIDFLNEHTNCPSCNQAISPEFKCSTIAEKTASNEKIEAALNEVRAKIEQIEMDEEFNNQLSEQISALNNAITHNERQIGIFRRMIDQLLVKISKTQEELTQKQVTVDIDALNQQLIALDALIIEQQDDLAVQNHAAMLLKDSGIKAQFLKVYIPIINGLMKKNLMMAECWTDFILDENFEAQIKRGGHDFVYEQFSEGEKAKLNVAILFTWRELARIRGSFDCNLIVFDELLDGPLDVDNLEDVIKAIKTLTNDENVIIISHKVDQIADKFNRVIEVQNYREFSRMTS